MMEIRRRVLLGSRKKVIDTSPKIAEYGKYCNRSGQGLADSPDWCYTQYYVPLEHRYQYICDNNTDSGHTWQYIANDEGTTWDFWYGPRKGCYPRYAIRFSIKIEKLNIAYAYSETTGQIFFAGKDSPYYGYTNINDMPQ